MLRQHQMVQQHQQYYLDQKHRQQQRRQQQQHHRQQQQQQEQKLRLQQYQQRHKRFRYRQQQQQQQYHLQQQYKTSCRQQHKLHYQAENANKTSEAQRVEVRADGEAAQVEKGCAPPTSQTTLKPQSFCEYPAMLFASQQVCRKALSTHEDQLESMQNGLLGKSAQNEEEEKFEE